MSRRASLSLSLALCFSVVGITEAAARTPVDAMTGKVSLSRDKLPGKSGDAAHVRAMSRSARGRAIFREDTKAGAWKIHYAAVAKQPVQGATVTIFDVTHGKKLVTSKDKMLYAESRIVSGTLTLKRDEVFDPNARMLIVVDVGGRVIGQRTFYIQGRAERFSGEVSFDAEDTGSAADDVDADDVRTKSRRH